MDLIHIHPSKEALAWKGPVRSQITPRSIGSWKGPVKRLSILRASAIAASCCFGVWVDRCSSSLALHPSFWTSLDYCAKFFILPGSSENLSLPISHIRSCCCRKDLCTVCVLFAVSFEYNINIFHFIHFFQQLL